MSWSLTPQEEEAHARGHTEEDVQGELIDLGSARPDDPIFSEPVRVFFPLRLRPSTRNPQESADGTGQAGQGAQEEEEEESQEVPPWRIILIR